MSGLIPFAVLASTVCALRGATLVGTNVVEAPLDALEDVLGQFDGRPLLTVLVGHGEKDIEGREILRGDHKLELAIQAYLPERCTVDVDGSPVVLDTRGKGIEIAFSAIWRQVTRALLVSDGPWAEIWRQFVLQTPRADSQAFLLQLGETRIAAREFVLTCDTLYEPPFGAPPAGVWADFIAGLRGVEDYGDAIADLIAFEIEAPEGLPSWRAIQASLGLTNEAIGAMGLAPFPDGADVATGEAPIQTQANLTDASDGSSLTIALGALEPYEVPPG